MKISKLIEALVYYQNAYGASGDLEVDMIIDYEDGQYEAPITDTAYDGKRVILIYEESVHRKDQ